MKAKIDITTPAGKSLEGFPKELDETRLWPAFDVKECIIRLYTNEHSLDKHIQLHPGDKITIEILP